MYVARVKKDGQWANAKPCATCLHWMLIFGIEKVCYTTGDIDSPYRIAKIADLIQEPLYFTAGTRNPVSH